MTSPIVWMTAASFVCWAALSLVMGPAGRSAVLLGSLGPLVAAVATWIVVEGLHARKPEQVSHAMIKLLAAKMLFFGGYVAAALALLKLPARAFVVSFTSQYIMLHLIESVLLRRLFAGHGRRADAD